MSVERLKNIAEGFRGCKGNTTLSAEDTETLQLFVNRARRPVSIVRHRNGGCVIKCEDLCDLVLQDDDRLLLSQVPTTGEDLEAEAMDNPDALQTLNPAEPEPVRAEEEVASDLVPDPDFNKPRRSRR